MTMEERHVVTCFLEHGGEIPLLRRSQRVGTYKGRWAGVSGYIEEIMGGIRPLQDAGADFIIMAANSPHAVYHQVEAQTRVPMISIVQATVRKASELGLSRLLLLGIKFTMESDFYPRACREEGIDLQAP